jgi:hypothetical protein
MLARVLLHSVFTAALLFPAGCDPSTGSEEGSVSDELRRRRPAPPAADAGAPRDAGGFFPGAGCELCTKAQECCNVVASGGPVCSFSAATCEAYPPDIERIYISNCRVFLRTVHSAWSGNPPAVCR